MYRKLFALLVFLSVIPRYAPGQESEYVRPRFNFSSYDILIRKELLETGASFVFFGESQPLLNGFFAPVSFVDVDGRSVRIENAVFVNVDLVVRTGMSVNRVVVHELTHFRQYKRCHNYANYLTEWRRQQALSYWERPWEKEAHQAEAKAGACVKLLGARNREAVTIVFESDRGRLAARPRH